MRNIHWRQLLEQPATFVKWLVFAAVSGAVCGGVAAAFYHAFEAVTTLRQAHSWLLFLLPLGGAAIVLLYRVCGMEGDRGTNFVRSNGCCSYTDQDVQSQGERWCHDALLRAASSKLA